MMNYNGILSIDLIEYKQKGMKTPVKLPHGWEDSAI
jgi:hypothetical protein